MNDLQRTIARVTPMHYEKRQLMSFLIYLSLFHMALGVDRITTSSNPKSEQFGRDQMVADQSMHSDPSSTLVTLSYGINADRKALITCEVDMGNDTNDLQHSRQIKQIQSKVTEESSSGPTVSAVYLLCPQVTTSVCYMDCMPSCVLGENGCHVPKSISQVIDECTYDRPSPTRITVSYVVNLETLNISGQWNCDYQGQRALRPLDLRAAERRKTTAVRSKFTASKITTSRPTNDEIISSTTAAPIAPASIGFNASRSAVMTQVVQLAAATTSVHGQSKRKTYVRDSEKLGERKLNSDVSGDSLPKSGFNREKFDLFNLKLTRPELVIILIIVLTLSLLVNIVLSIRCALTKTYIEHLTRGKVDPCLETILCFKLQQKTGSRPRSDLLFGSISNGPIPRGDLSCTMLPSHYVTGMDNPNTRSATDALLFFPSANTNGMNGTLGAVNLNSPALSHTRSNLHSDGLGVSPVSGSNYVSFGPLGTNMLVSQQVSAGQENGNSDAFGNTSGTCVTNGSLTNSIVLTNDSVSYTDGPNSNRPSYMVIHSNAQSPNLNRPLSKDDSIHLSPTYFVPHMDGKRVTVTEQQTVPLQRSQQQSHSQAHTKMLYEELNASQPASNPFPSSMTPMLVRLPSGESGYFICPQQQTIGTGSLPKTHRTPLSAGNFFPFSGRIGHGSMRQKTNSTLLTTTDTDSESGPIDRNHYFPFSQQQQQRETEPSRLVNHHASGNEVGNSTGSENGQTMDLILSRQIGTEFKCPSDDAGTTATNNSLITIDRSNSEAESMQNGSHIPHRLLPTSQEPVKMHLHLTTERLNEFVAGQNSSCLYEMSNGHMDHGISQQSST